MTRWLRWYAGTSEDGKFRFVARNADVTVATVIGVWAALLEDASHADHRGVVTRNETFFAAVLDLDDGQMGQILAGMEDAGLVSIGAGAITIVNWKERQFETDAKDPTNAERQRRHREKRKANADASSRNGTVTATTRPESESDTETEEQSVSHTPEPARENGRTDDPNFVKCKLALNGSTSRLIDEIKNSEGPYGTKARAAEWLADTLDDFGAAAIVDAFRFLEKCRADGQTIRDPKGFLTKNAQRYVENQSAKKAAETDKRAGLKPMFNRMTGEIEWRKPYEPYVEGHA
jgi:hypothetical protein